MFRGATIVEPLAPINKADLFSRLITPQLEIALGALEHTIDSANLIAHDAESLRKAITDTTAELRRPTIAKGRLRKTLTRLVDILRDIAGTVAMGVPIGVVANRVYSDHLDIHADHVQTIINVYINR